MRQRGKCSLCGYSVTLRKNGLPERHYLYTGGKWACPGGEKERMLMDKPNSPLATWLLYNQEETK